MNKILLLFLCGIGLTCRAQTVPEEVPAGNPVKFPTGAAEWTIDVTYPSAQKPLAATGGAAPATPAVTSGNAGHQSRIQVTSSDALQHLVITWGNGRKTEQWHYKAAKYVVTTDTTNGTPVCFSDANTFMKLAHATGFEEAAFSWLKRGNFKDTVSYRGRPCLRYQAKLEMNDEEQYALGGAYHATGNLEAWIDKETFLPVAFNDGTKVGVYTFAKNPPAEPLVAPKAIEDEFKSSTTLVIPPRH